MAEEAKAAGGGPAKKVVYVRAVPRPNFGGFGRIGRHFPSASWTKAEVTDAELAELVAVPEMLIVVDQKPFGYVETPAPAATEPGPQQPGAPPGAPPGSPPPVDAVYTPAQDANPPHDALGLDRAQAAVADRAPKPQGRR